MAATSKTYDPNNIFAKVLRGEIPCKKVYEDAHVLAFHDVNPQAPIHILIVPKAPYVSWDDFSAKATDVEIAAFVRAAGTIARELGADENGYRVLANIGADGGQEVPHFHLHLFAGRPLGRMVVKASGG